MRLADFTLQEVIGRGGMGEVWRGLHRPTGAPAAVKFDLAPPDPEYQAAFFHEVRLVAGLDHPNCVQVLDAGTVQEDDEIAVAGKLQAGAPWLAMELASAGAMSRKNPPRTWDGMRHVLRSLLMALQHAHSRGVIHRDIKFGNLLLAGPPGDIATTPHHLLEARVVLSDFGIGHMVDRPEAHSEHSAGTPHYMAPEQIEGEWRNHGPWTDLYQVGVLAWCMATGAYPFRGRTAIQLLAAHMSHKPPPFQPVLIVPDGLDALLRRLLEKDPADRFRFAADALEALEALPHPGGEETTEFELAEELPTISLHGISTRSGLKQTPAPLTARTGTGLWGLKVLPLMGRGTEQERLQIALRRSVARKKAEVVVLKGTAGTGRTRLTRWLREWAHAEGLAEGVVATYGPRAEAGQGLIAGLKRYLRLDGLDPEGLTERLHDLLGTGPYIDAFERILNGERLAVGPRRKTRAVVLRKAAEVVPLVVVLDDVHHWPESIESMDAVLSDLAAFPAPILFVITAEDDALAARPELDAALNAFCDKHAAETLQLAPLPRGQHRALVRRLLGLEGSLAEKVERRSAGNPGLAVQWVGHWVENGWLVQGRRGLRLAEGVSAEPPSDLVDVWRAKVERLGTDWSADDHTALQIAAILGVAFDVFEWMAACGLAGVSPSENLLAELIKGRLAAGEDARLRMVRFAHALLVEALQQTARESGSFEALSAACADAIEKSGRRDPTRLARLRLGAGQLEKAADSLRWAIEDQLYESDARSDSLLDKYRDTLARLDLPDDDLRHANLWLVESWIDRLRSEFDAAEAAANKALKTGEQHDWYMVPARALRELGQIAVARGDFETALGCYHRAARLASDVGRTEFAAHCVVGEGDALLFLGRLEDAREAFLEVHDAFENTHAWRLSHEPPLALANGAIRSGDYDRAVTHLELAKERAERAKVHGALARISNLQGEVARHRGDLPGAAALYTEAAERFRALEHAHAAWPELNVGLCLVLDGRYEEARAKMEQLLMHSESMPVVAGCARFVAWAAAANEYEWEAMAQQVEPLKEFVRRTQVAEKDLATLSKMAADAALNGGQTSRATEAYELLVGQLDRLGRTEELRTAREKLAELRRS